MKALWVVDALFLAVALGIALFATGQDAAGRGLVWFFPVAIGAALGASWLADRAGMRGLAVGLAAVAPVVAAVVALAMGRSWLAERRVGGGSAYWDDSRLRAAARAISDGDTAAVRAAARGLDLETEGRDGMTLLTFAVVHRPEMVAPLLALGARPDHAPDGTLSPLALALESSGPAFDALLAGGADPNGPGNGDAPILFAAIRSPFRSRYDALVARGADVTRLDAAGRTALFAAVGATEWRIALDLLDRGVDPKRPAADGSTLAALLERMHGTDDDGDPDYRALAARVAARVAPQ